MHTLGLGLGLDCFCAASYRRHSLAATLVYPRRSFLDAPLSYSLSPTLFCAHSLLPTLFIPDAPFATLSAIADALSVLEPIADTPFAGYPRRSFFCTLSIADTLLHPHSLLPTLFCVHTRYLVTLLRPHSLSRHSFAPTLVIPTLFCYSDTLLRPHSFLWKLLWS